MLLLPHNTEKIPCTIQEIKDETAPVIQEPSMKPLRSQLPCRSDAGNSGLLSAAEQVQASVTGLHHQFVTGN
ncbi:hypothetical protein AM380_19615 [Morganella morganii]|uniref:Uncharacterized protein n=1 Tax=Morganella morganii TaxID=582 RepID=A0AAU8ZS63_MORMO|nr:hypothetical protein AM380_19615 [Morganella morganii]